ncbi:hypothetical protein PFISCL1PPCAC_25701, partial [Pristionchus fissidentatus]
RRHGSLLEDGERLDECIAQVAHLRFVLRLGLHVVDQQLVDGQVLLESLNRAPSILAHFHKQLVERRRVEVVECGDGGVKHHKLRRLAAARRAHHHSETYLVLEEPCEDRGMVELGEPLRVPRYRFWPLEALHEAHDDGIGAA